MTTTAHTAAGLVPICHCGWTPPKALATEAEVVLAEVQHNAGFTLSECPHCGHPLTAVRARWKVPDRSVHYVDRRCSSCGWQASKSP